MHVMEEVQEGSDVPQPSSPGHADQGTEPPSPSSLKNGDCDSPKTPSTQQPNGTSEAVKKEATEETEESIEPGLLLNDKTNGDSSPQPSKRKAENEEGPLKKVRSDIQQSYAIRDKILDECLEAAGCATVEQMQNFMDQTVSEIKMLNELAREKEREWNNIIHLKKLKEELVLRIQRQKQVMVLQNEKIDLNNHDLLGESQAKLLEERLRGNHEGSNHGYKSNSFNSGLLISSTSSQGLRISNAGGLVDRLQSSNKERINLPRAFANAGIEINGQGIRYKQTAIRQRPMLDVQSIIADYNQKHPEAVPRRGRRIRSLPSSQGDNAVLANKQTGGRSTPNYSQYGRGVDPGHEMLLNAMDNGDRQEMLQHGMKPPPPYSEVTMHPVMTNAQSTSSSLLHGILTKTTSQAQSRLDTGSKTTFSPTLARLLTAPERAATSSPHNISNGSAPVSISDILSNNKARNEITITPVVGMDIMVKPKEEEDEQEDGTDRLVIDESESSDGRNRDTGSDGGDEIPQCQGCNQKPAQFVCAGCGNQWYCSRDCQVAAWDDHSEICSG